MINPPPLPAFLMHGVNNEYETWADEFGIGDDQYLWPYFNQLDDRICFQPNSTWFDNKTTPNKALLNVCKSSFSSTVEQFSSIDSIAQQWQFFQGTDISHIAKFWIWTNGFTYIWRERYYKCYA